MVRLSALLLGLLSFSVVSLANQTQLTLVTEHLPPYQIVDEHGQISGFATELIELLMQESKLSYRHNAYSWTRSYNLAKTRENTCIYSIARIPSREQLFKWVGALTDTQAVVYAHNDNKKIVINTLADAKNYTIAVIRDDVTHQALLARGFEENKNLYVIDNTKSLLTLLIHKDEIDLIVADDITLPYRAEIADVDLSLIRKVLEIDGLSLNFYLACSPTTNDAIISKLKYHLSLIKKSEQYQRILARWQYNIPAPIKQDEP